jgi:tetratricopeptide (TPR) repeat protein
MARLAACDAPEGLKQIVRDCLEPPRAARPRDAGVVAQRLAGHFARVEERARAADVAAARARNEAMLSRAQRRRSLVLAGMVMLAVGTGGGGWLYLDAERAAREASVRPRIDAALSTAGELAARSQWDGALTAARQAIRLADVEGVDGARARGVLASLERDSAATLAATRAAAADAVLLVELEKLRSNHGELVGPGVGSPMLQANVQDAAATDAGYAAAFARRFGSLEAGVEHMAASPQKTRFAEHLAFWCRLRKRKPRDAEWQPLRDLALRIDPENGPLREALIDGDAATLRGLVADGAAGVPPVLAAEFALSLVEVGEHEVAIPWMRRQLLVHGDDVALHLAMAQACRRAGAARDALDHATAAVALRPRSVLAWTSLARGHDVAEEHEQALRAAERAAAIDPDDRDVALVIVAVMTALGREEELLRRTEDVLSRSPDDLAALSQRVAILHERRDYAAASAAQRRLHELLPDDRQVLGALALTLSTLGQADEAVRVVEANALRHPDDDFLAQLRETLLTDQRSRKEQEARLDAKIERLAAGEEVETSAPESADLAGRCDDVGRYDLAVALWQRAFGQLPSLADDPWQANRYDAARSAVLAGPATHGQALSWLTDELAALTREAGQRPADVVRSLLHWQRDPDLAVVRDGDQPPAEFQAFWKDVADRLAELQK